MRSPADRPYFRADGKKEWEKEKYIQTTIEISDGEQVFSMRHRHDDTPYQLPKLFIQVTVKVTYAATERERSASRVSW